MDALKVPAPNAILSRLVLLCDAHLPPMVSITLLDLLLTHRLRPQPKPMLSGYILYGLCDLSLCTLFHIGPAYRLAFLPAQLRKY